MVLSPLARIVAVSALLAGAHGAAAQTSPEPGCTEVLARAEERYASQVYSAVEPLVLDCVGREAAAPGEVQRAQRLLALSYIKQGLFARARGVVADMLEVDPAYQGDLTADLPVYVALVDGVREQARRGEVSEREAPAAGAPTADAPAVPAVPPAPTPVDVNTADVGALDAVPGIGPALAARIVAYRSENGPFRSVGEVEAVRGIGPRSLERMRPFLTVGEGGPGAVLQVGTPEDGTAGTAPGRPPVNLNTATTDELETLPGIGPALARRIVEYRTEFGPFRDVGEVTLVRGIGPRTLEGFAHRATVE